MRRGAGGAGLRGDFAGVGQLLTNEGRLVRAQALNAAADLRKIGAWL